MKVAVLGSGNGAHAVAFDFSKAGHNVYMCDFPMFPTNIAAIAEQGGIYAEGELEGFQKVVYAGHDFETAVKDADAVLVVATAEATVPFAKECKPYVKEGQMFIICPGSCFGSIEFKQTLGYALADESIYVAETHTLPYAVRISEPGKIRVANRLKGGYRIAAVPKSLTVKVHEFMKTVYAEIETAGSVVETSLQNANPAIHPSVMLSNIARVENQLPWLFYHEGVTTGVGRIIKSIDEERIAIGAACGVKIMDDPTIGYIQGYMFDKTYDVGYSKAPGFAGIMAPTTADHRYFNEDVNGLCLWEDMGKYLGVPTPHISTVINMACIVRDKDYRAIMTKSVKSLGLDEFLETEL